MFPYLQYLLYSKIIFIAIDIKYLSKLGGYHVIYIFHSIIIIVYNNPNNLFYSQFYQQRVEGTKNQNVTHTKVFVCIHRELKERMKRNLSYDFVLYKVMITKTKTMLPIFSLMYLKEVFNKKIWINAQEEKNFDRHPYLDEEIKTIAECIHHYSCEYKLIVGNSC